MAMSRGLFQFSINVVIIVSYGHQRKVNDRSTSPYTLLLNLRSFAPRICRAGRRARVGSRNIGG